MPMNSYWRKKFAWSNSCHNLWEECKKQYYFHYIKSFDGLPNDKRREFLWDLRRLQKLVFLKGRLIHDAIKEQIAAGSLDEEAAVHFFTKNFDSTLENREKLIAEAYNGFMLDDMEINSMREDGVSQLRNFCRLIWPSFSESRYIEHENLKKFEVSGLDIYLVCDLITENSGFYVITDWKTGSEGYDDLEDDIQLGVYILWANLEKKIPLENIIAEKVYLRSGKKEVTKRNQEQLEELVLFMKKDAQDMLAVKDEKDFPASPGTKCKSCNFLRLCEEGKNTLGIVQS